MTKKLSFLMLTAVFLFNAKTILSQNSNLAQTPPMGWNC